MSATALTSRAVVVHRGSLLDALYLIAVLVAVVVGGPTQLALAVPVAGVLGLRAAHRRRVHRIG